MTDADLQESVSSTLEGCCDMPLRWCHGRKDVEGYGKSAQCRRDSFLRCHQNSGLICRCIGTALLDTRLVYVSSLSHCSLKETARLLFSTFQVCPGSTSLAPASQAGGFNHASGSVLPRPNTLCQVSCHSRWLITPPPPIQIW